MRNENYSSSLRSRLLRGIALGCCCMTLILSSVMQAQAAEVVEDVPDMIEPGMEDENSGADDDTGTPMDDGASDPDIGETGPDNPEDEVENTPSQVGCTCAETLISFFSTEMTLDEEIIVYENLSEFEASTAVVDRYQYELLKRLEFMQYAQAIMIGLIFVLIFKKK